MNSSVKDTWETEETGRRKAREEAIAICREKK